jgi:hypothetical protein
MCETSTGRDAEGNLLVQWRARQKRIMPPLLGKRKSIAQAEPHKTNRSMIDSRKACGWRVCPRAEKNERSIRSYFRICALSGPPASSALASAADEKADYVRPVGQSGVSPIAEVVGFKGERHKPSYRSVTPLDARRLPTFN